jgi:hypothetical protein
MGPSLELVNSGGEDEIIFGEAVDLVRVKGDFYLAPGEEDIGVMALLLGDGAYLISEFQSRFEVGERERPSDVMFAHGFPAACMLDQPIEFTSLYGRDAAFAGNALLGGKIDRGCNFRLGWSHWQPHIQTAELIIAEPEEAILQNGVTPDGPTVSLMSQARSPSRPADSRKHTASMTQDAGSFL